MWKILSNSRGLPPDAIQNRSPATKGLAPPGSKESEMETPQCVIYSLGQ